MRVLYNAIPASFAALLLASDVAQGSLSSPAAFPPRRDFGGAGQENSDYFLCGAARTRAAGRAAGLESEPCATLGGLDTTLPAPFLLSVGGVSKAHTYKGVDMVIRAMPRILAAVPAAHYVVVGDGDNRRELERLAEREGVARRVRFVGEIRDAQLATLYRTCDLFVMPSRVSECAGQWTGEGFGRVYVEAALAGKPVVGSRGGGAAEAVLDGETGLLVDPLSLDEIAEAVVRLLSNPEAARSMGTRAREWAVENFTLPVMQRALEEMLEPYCRPHRARLSIPSLLPGEKVADVGGRMRGLSRRKHGAVEETPHRSRSG
jgi:glycosyltransferase involved in cell wall biosynthesis